MLANSLNPGCNTAATEALRLKRKSTKNQRRVVLAAEATDRILPGGGALAKDDSRYNVRTASVHYPFGGVVLVRGWKSRGCMFLDRSFTEQVSINLAGLICAPIPVQHNKLAGRLRHEHKISQLRFSEMRSNCLAYFEGAAEYKLHCVCITAQGRNRSLRRKFEPG